MLISGDLPTFGALGFLAGAGAKSATMTTDDAVLPSGAPRRVVTGPRPIPPPVAPFFCLSLVGDDDPGYVDWTEMAKCTAPVLGHRTASGAANCPACSSRALGGRSYSTYPSSVSSGSSSSSQGSSGGSRSSSRPRWSKPGSLVVYTAAEVRTLTPLRENFEKLASKPDRRDVFLCHAWADRKGAAKDLNDLLVSKGVSTWFSEKDVPLGTLLLREIDKGLAKSRVGIVLVTPALLERVKNEGIADKELSVLLASDRLVPVVHGTTFEALRDVSPLLGSRSGMSTADEPLAGIASKLAEVVTP